MDVVFELVGTDVILDIKKPLDFRRGDIVIVQGYKCQIRDIIYNLDDNVKTYLMEEI